MGVTIKRFLIGAVLVAGTTAALPKADISDAHLRLTASNPAKDTTLTTAPEKISLWYSLPPNLKLSRVSLSGPNGALKVGKVLRDSKNPKLLTVAISSTLSTGNYVISWITASSDGHPIKGEIPFSLKVAE